MPVGTDATEMAEKFIVMCVRPIVGLWRKAIIRQKVKVSQITERRW